MFFGSFISLCINLTSRSLGRDTLLRSGSVWNIARALVILVQIITTCTALPTNVKATDAKLSSTGYNKLSFGLRAIGTFSLISFARGTYDATNSTSNSIARLPNSLDVLMWSGTLQMISRLFLDRSVVCFNLVCIFFLTKLIVEHRYILSHYMMPIIIALKHLPGGDLIHPIITVWSAHLHHVIRILILYVLLGCFTKQAA